MGGGVGTGHTTIVAMMLCVVHYLKGAGEAALRQGHWERQTQFSVHHLTDIQKSVEVSEVGACAANWWVCGALNQSAQSLCYK